MATTFDTHAFVKKLTEAGFTERQAEVQADTLAAIIDDQMATKRDLKELEDRMTFRMAELEYRLIIKLGAMMAGSIAAVAALVKLL